jgi:hypothetical protein
MPLPDLSPDGGGIDLMLPEMKTFLLKPDLWKPEASP